jgi:hypothetical protein
MRISGFTIVRNALKFDYPVVEAIKSVLPICDEFIVLIGNSEDDTLGLIEQIGSPKIKIHHSIWDDTLRKGGRVLAVETDKAFKLIDHHSQWAFYIQADEVLHEKYHQTLLNDMQDHLNNPKVEGILLNYKHFYGSYDFIADSRRWYRKEVRIVRNNPAVTSFRDAQGFRYNGRLIRVKASKASMYHYGWVKSPEKQQEKQKAFHKLWHTDEWVEQKTGNSHSFDYGIIDSLALFNETHPSTMHARIQEKNWHFDFDPTQKNFGLKNRFLHCVEKQTGWRIGEYKNYVLV